MKKLVIIAVLALLSCGDDEKDSRVGAEPVPETLYTRHVSGFYAAAEAHGIILEEVTPKVVWKKIVDGTTCNGAMVTSTSSSADKVTIEINDLMKEFENDLNFGVIIYREMAHQLLDKPYSNLTQGPNGELVIMHRCANIYEFANGTVKEPAIEYLFNN